MKALLVFLVLISASLASAEEISLLNRAVSISEDFESAKFQVNQELGRAWVEIEVVDTTFEDATFETERIYVEGLRYDPETKKVLLETDGRIIDCGVLRKRKFVLGSEMSVKNSGSCTFTSQNKKVRVDNGFEILNQRKLQVNLVIP